MLNRELLECISIKSHIDSVCEVSGTQAEAKSVVRFAAVASRRMRKLGRI